MPSPTPDDPQKIEHPRDPLAFAGIRIQRYGRVEAMDAVALAAQMQPVRVFWVYANCVNVAQDDPDYRHALERAEFVLNDGAGIELAGVCSGRRVLGNLIGTDWIPDFLTRHQGKQSAARVFLLGGHPERIDAAVATVSHRWPHLDVVGFHHGYFDRTESEGVLNKIAAARPDLLIVGMGVPLQERWIDTHWERLTAAGVRVALAGGAIIDHFAGALTRAPRWIRRLRGEWLYRLITEPRRLWRRYLIGNFRFLWLLGMDAVRGFPEAQPQSRTKP